MKHWMKYSIIMMAVCGILLCGCHKRQEVSDHVEKDSVQETEEVEKKIAATSEQFISEEQTEELPATEESQGEEDKEPAVLVNLESELSEFIASSAVGAKTSVYVLDLTDGDYVSIGGGAMQSASLIKLYVAGCVFEHLEELESLENTEGETKALVHQMITVSDNDATNTLVTRLGGGMASEGMELVNSYCRNHGFVDTSMGRLMLDFSAQTDNYTSVSDCAHFLQQIVEGSLIGSDSILEELTQQERTGKIPAGVPEGVVTANKTGELEDVENDAAIIFKDHNPYIVCIMMSGLTDTAAGRETIVNMSSKIYNYFISFQNNEDLSDALVE